MSSFWVSGKGSQQSEAEEQQLQQQRLLLNNYNGSSSLVKPPLSRQSCVSTKTLRAFLKKSRLYADDTLKEKINSKNGACTEIVNTILVPSWKDRLEIIDYCNNEATTLSNELKENQQELQEKQEFNLRVNPYAQEDFENLQNEKYEELNRLRNWVSNETMIERIIIGRSLNSLADSCFNFSVPSLVEDLKKQNLIREDD